MSCKFRYKKNLLKLCLEYPSENPYQLYDLSAICVVIFILFSHLIMLMHCKTGSLVFIFFYFIKTQNFTRLASENEVPNRAWPFCVRCIG